MTKRGRKCMRDDGGKNAGEQQKEYTNCLKNANLMIVKLLINVSDIPWCVGVHARACLCTHTCVSLWDKRLGTAKADYEIKWDASGK